MLKNGLIRKIRLISKVMTSQPGWQTISIHILTIISRSEGSHTMKCGQLIEYNTRNIFLEKSYPKCGGNLFSDPFLKNQNWANSGSIVCFIKSVFIVCQVEDYRNILKLSFRPLAFTSNKAFKKTKRGLELVSLPYFLRDF